MWELSLLGPVQLRLQARPVDLGTPKQRAVLAALAVDLGHPVPVPVLVDRIWDDSPPPNARNVLYSHLSRLRTSLRAATRAAADPPVLTRLSAGYRLDGDPDRVDLCRFRRLTDRCADPGLPAAEVAARLRAALSLWRGPALADVPGAWAARVRDGWQQQRLAVVRTWARAELALARPGAVVDELQALVVEHPLVEPLVALLMRALHADGRAAEALHQYALVRRRLADELGADPGPELRELNRAILCDTVDLPAAAAGTKPAPAGPAPALAAPAPAAAGTARTAPEPPAPEPPAPNPHRRPAQLPADIASFTGRQPDLNHLDRLLPSAPTGSVGASVPGLAETPTEPGGPPAGLPIAVVAGTAGVGKTALAVRWAHGVAHRFADGQLYVDLRGYDPDRPVAAGDALARFLRALGVPGEDIPLDVDERAARYRTETAGRRLLILLDNARSAEQVRPLLPGTPTCLVVVTSRDALTGLVAVHGANRVDLDLLPPTDAVALLRRLIGPRVEADPEAAAALAAQCARLPLALRVAAELAGRRDQPLGALAAELADAQRRLDVLDTAEDPRAAVRTVFSWSLQDLPADTARAFRLLGLHPGPDLDGHAAAALAGCTVGRAGQVLDALARAHLVQPGASGRYGMHELLRGYAVSLAGAEDTEGDRRAALDRLFDYYVAAAAAALDAWYPAEAHRRPRIAAPGSAIPEFGSAAAALAWLDAERPVLLAACAHAAAHDRPAHAVALAATLYRYLDVGGHHAEALAVHTDAGRAARRSGDRAGEATALINLATCRWRHGQYDPAAEHLQRALLLLRAVGDHSGEARAQANTGLVRFWQGRYDPAAAHFRRALELYRQLGDRPGQAGALGSLGDIHSRQGRYGPAAGHYQEAGELYRTAGDQDGEAWALSGLGDVHSRQDQQEPAGGHYQAALELFRRIGDSAGEAYALTGLGTVEMRQSRPERAGEYQERALQLCRQAGDRAGEAQALNGLGESTRAAGHPELALDRHAAALDLAVDTGERYLQAAAHDGLALAHHALGNRTRAGEHWQRALALHTELGTPEAGRIRASLAAVAEVSPRR